MTLRVLVAAAVLATTFAVTPSGAWAEALVSAKDPADAQMKKMLDAVKAGSYQAFLADATPRLKGLGKPSFDLASAHFAPMLLKGYKTTLLGKVRKADHTIDIWKLQPASGPDEYEVRLVTKDGKVDGFQIQ